MGSCRKAFELVVIETPDVSGLCCGTGLNVEHGRSFLRKRPPLYHIRAHSCVRTPVWVLIPQFRLMVVVVQLTVWFRFT
ncbi:hypothetical protein VZT92_024187 [Zoarces viviparus]|uniref:Uncharacterized protein n=1 Tax=Zoarces viviparus TaxID=48416 RepID=A0AAW1E0U1_ZOAVI